MSLARIVFALLVMAEVVCAQTPDALAAKAEALIRQNDLPGALNALQEAAQRPGTSAQSEDKLGFLYAVLGQPTAARGHFEKALHLNSGYAPAHYHLGAALCLAKDFDQGVPELEAAVKLAPRAIDYRYRLGAAYLELNQFEQAEAELKVAVVLDGATAEIWAAYARALRGAGKLNEGVAAYEKALKMAPGQAPLRNSLAMLLIETREPERAIKESNIVLAQMDSSAADKSAAQMNIGYAHLKTGEFSKAEAAYRDALRTDSENPAGHYDLAIALKMQDQVEAAEQELRRALELDPQMAEAHYSLGIAAWQLGQFEQAIENMRSAIAIRPAYAEAHYMLGIVLKQSGDLDGAIPELKEASRLDPTTPGPYNTLGQIWRIKGDKQASEEAFATGAKLKSTKEGQLAHSLEEGMRGGSFLKPIPSANKP